MSRRILLIDADTAVPRHADAAARPVSSRGDDRARCGPRARARCGAIRPTSSSSRSKSRTRRASRRSRRRARRVGKLPIVLVTRVDVDGQLREAPRPQGPRRRVHRQARARPTDELVGKLDNLIGLGDLQEEDVSIPVEDDIPMEIADGDVVLDEQLDDDPARGVRNAHEMATVGGNNADARRLRWCPRRSTPRSTRCVDDNAPGMPIPDRADGGPPTPRAEPIPADARA